MTVRSSQAVRVYLVIWLAAQLACSPASPTLVKADEPASPQVCNNPYPELGALCVHAVKLTNLTEEAVVVFSFLRDGSAVKLAELPPLGEYSYALPPDRLVDLKAVGAWELQDYNRTYGTNYMLDSDAISYLYEPLVWGIAAPFWGIAEGADTGVSITRGGVNRSLSLFSCVQSEQCPDHGSICDPKLFQCRSCGKDDAECALVAVQKSGAGRGIIRSDDAHPLGAQTISCGEGCEGYFRKGTTARFIAKAELASDGSLPNSNFFTGWHPSGGIIKKDWSGGEFTLTVADMNPRLEAEFATCGASLVQCSGRCVDLQSDRLNCGSCGTVCVPNTACQSATCR